MGSQGPKLPVDFSHLERALNDESDVLRNKWGGTNLYNRAMTMGTAAPPYKPSKRSAATIGRILLPGGKCHLFKQMRTMGLRILRQFRQEMQNVYEKANGPLNG